METSHIPKIYEVGYVDPKIREKGKGPNRFYLQIAAFNGDTLETFQMDGGKSRVKGIHEAFTKGIAKDGYATLIN